MKILSAQQTQDLDQATMEREPIRSLDLMERASLAFYHEFKKYYPDKDRPICILCGTGNNGGDGLAVARLLHHAGYGVTAWLAKISEEGSPDYTANLKRLPRWNAVKVVTIEKNSPFPDIPDNAVIIDGLFGSGLNRPVEGYWSDLLEYLNRSPANRVAIDIPSGVFADKSSEGVSFHADQTITFECPKLAFFLPENEDRIGDWSVVSIGLHPLAMADLETPFYFTTEKDAAALWQPRKRFAHKGTQGHALMICGSFGMIGAAILSVRSCLRSGSGLVTAHLPTCGYQIMQSSVPEALVSLDCHRYYWSEVPATENYAAIGVGCGIGQKATTSVALQQLLQNTNKPMVIDADALNLLSQHTDWMDRIPAGSILTPHPGEYRRLAGSFTNHLDRLKNLRELARNKKCTFVLKGAFTAVALPSGEIHFNGSGNPGMATAGSGDVLTGLLTGLLAQGYSSESAAVLGVYIHGLAGDLAAEQLGHEALLASDLVDHLGKAFHRLKQVHAT
jgi:NAD(P)H-hydrate epimerase